MDHSQFIRWGLNLVELLACVTGIVYWKKLRHSHWKWFPIYLAAIVIVELAGKYIREVRGDVALNSKLYLYFGIPLQFLFFYWLFRQYYKYNMARLKNWPLVAAAAYITSWIVDIAYLSEEKLWFFSFSYTIGNIMLLILIIAFFARLAASEEVLQFRTNLMFWVCLGLLIFYMGTLPFYGLHNTLRTRYPAIFMVYWYIQFGLNYLMYISFILAMIWSKPK
ncbi:hypothetical protein AB6805_29695 [Chitinophaga sp. RCC_12]|uniref:hypothetical protein n=1 Tax=Chitinophaga sp. RCC_12 TaxID=3239226 RepID=UPI003524435F